MRVLPHLMARLSSIPTGRIVLFFPSLDIISFLENAAFCRARLLHGFLWLSVDLDRSSSNVSATRHGESIIQSDIMTALLSLFIFAPGSRSTSVRQRFLCTPLACYNILSLSAPDYCASRLRCRAYCAQPGIKRDI